MRILSSRFPNSFCTTRTDCLVVLSVIEAVRKITEVTHLNPTAPVSLPFMLLCCVANTLGPDLLTNLLTGQNITSYPCMPYPNLVCATLVLSILLVLVKRNIRRRNSVSSVFHLVISVGGCLNRMAVLSIIYRESRGRELAMAAWIAVNYVARVGVLTLIGRTYGDTKISKPCMIGSLAVTALGCANIYAKREWLFVVLYLSVIGASVLWKGCAVVKEQVRRSTAARGAQAAKPVAKPAAKKEKAPPRKAAAAVKGKAPAAVARSAGTGTKTSTKAGTSTKTSAVAGTGIRAATKAATGTGAGAKGKTPPRKAASARAASVPGADEKTRPPKRAAAAKATAAPKAR